MATYPTVALDQAPRTSLNIILIMIIYFSGTGNTALAAKLLSKALNDEPLLQLTSDMLLHPENHTLTPKEARLIWAFPIYSWGIPLVIVNFIRKVKIAKGAKDAIHYMLATCGDDMGYADRQWRKEMKHRELKARSVFAVRMPNTYVCMKGFDVDPEDLEREKLDEVPEVIRKIADVINNGGEDILIRKSFSWIKTYIIYPWFKKYAMSSKPFHFTEACMSCGKCAASCPMANISMKDRHPVWSENCAMCLRCYHICPSHAVAYGNTTAFKGQYNIKLNQL